MFTDNCHILLTRKSADSIISSDIMTIPHYVTRHDSLVAVCRVKVCEMESR